MSAMAAQMSFRIALAILAIATGSIVSAWIFQFMGYAPCELCLKERIPYYLGVPLAGFAVFAAALGRRGAAFSAFLLLAAVFAVGAGLGAYHAGVEWGFWPGPTDCSGPLSRAGSINDFLTALSKIKVVRCDEAALRVLGLSLAGWNAAISLGLAVLALGGAEAAWRTTGGA